MQPNGIILGVVAGLMAVAGSSLLGTESMLTRTFQPLDGLGSGVISIEQVTCHDFYGSSGQPAVIGLICAKNVLPTNAPKANAAWVNQDANLASICGVRFVCGDIQFDPSVCLDLADFKIPQGVSHSKEDIIRATLECLRRVLPDKLKKVPLTFKTTPGDHAWVEKIVTAFNVHDHSKPFFIPES